MLDKFKILVKQILVKIIRPKVFLFYWQKMDTENLGDYLSILILKGLGYECKHSPSSKHINLNLTLTKNPALTLYTIGTLIGLSSEKSKGKTVVWGSGIGYGEFDRSKNPQYVFTAVRGPLTRDKLKLPKDIPLGDPALLLPKLYTLEIKKNDHIAYVPHHSFSEFDLPEGATQFIDMNCQRSEVFDRIKQIAGAKFILAQSLHGAIIAQTYGVPWAFCSVGDKGEKINSFKWSDWGAYLGIEIKQVSNYKEGLKWWETEGKSGKIRDLDKLLKAFPHEELNKLGVERTKNL